MIRTRSIALEAKALVRWFEASLGLQDWTFNVCITDDTPAWVGDRGPECVGLCSSNRVHKLSEIWVKETYAADSGICWQRTLLHELWHGAMADVELERGTSSARCESLWNCLDGVLLAAWKVHRDEQAQKARRRERSASKLEAQGKTRRGSVGKEHYDEQQ